MNSYFITLRYKNWQIPFAILSMALFRIPLSLNKRLSLFKLMGTGRNGTFDIHPDLNSWVIMVFYKDRRLQQNTQLEKKLLGSFITNWISIFKLEKNFFHLEGITGHGSWDGVIFSKTETGSFLENESIATLTRATIRISRLMSFWKAVPSSSAAVMNNPGLIYSIGAGEIPLIKQATFSIWKSEKDLKSFAYQSQEHAEVIRRTRSEKWYSEELFYRFRILKSNVKC
jgi:hypothetical protein